MSVEIILVRHGQTRSNLTGYQMGRSDEGLDSEGLAQAQKTSARLSALPIASVYSSPLKRALSTAIEIAGPHNLKVKVLDDLTEIDFGEWHGLYASEIEKRWPELWRQWRTDPSQMTVPGGESFDHIAERVSRTLKMVIADNPDASSIIVTHEIIIKMAVIQLLGASYNVYRHFEIGNASLSRVQYRSNWPMVVTVNDKSHLEG